MGREGRSDEEGRGGGRMETRRCIFVSRRDVDRWRLTAGPLQSLFSKRRVTEEVVMEEGLTLRNCRAFCRPPGG